jgi:hypothetical protein
MLRKAAKLETKKDDVRLWLGAHDLSRVEWTASVPLPTADERRYEVGFEVEIPANVFTPHAVWEHLQIFTRLQSPSEEGPIEIEKGDIEELRRDVLGICHRLKMLRNAVEQAAGNARAGGDGVSGAVLDNVAAARALLGEVRRQLEIGDLSLEIARECRLSDELISHHVIEFGAACQRAIDAGSDAGGEDSRRVATVREVARFLDDELGYRRKRAWVTPRADSRAELSAFVDRASRLKKHFQDVLFLEAASYFVDSRVRYYVMIPAAALAAVVFLALTTLPMGTLRAVGVGTFLAVFAAGYALRDVIKEAVRGWITGRLMRLYGQRVVSLRLPPRLDVGRPIVCSTRETFDVADGPHATPAGESIGGPRRIMKLHFRMRAELEASPSLAALHIDSVKHIFRYDLSPIFSRLDDAVKPVPVIDGDGEERRVRFCDAPREYRLPARIRFTDGAETRTRDMIVVVTKRGVERVEAPSR